MKTTASLKFTTTAKLSLAVLFLVINFLATGQRIDTSYYLPQISLSAVNGFGPYVIGGSQENTFQVSELPANTSRLLFHFIDSDSIQVGSSYTLEGSQLTSASWQVQLDTFQMPLSPQLHLQVTYDADSTANYYIPYSVYPDTVVFYTSRGWGPFVTNSYTFSDTSWHPVPQLTNTFIVKNLPPRTDTVIFRILTSDSTVISSFTVVSAHGHFLDSAVFANVRMDNLPLSTNNLTVIIHAKGAPVKGLEFRKNLSATLQKPVLITKSQGMTFHDSIPSCMQNPVNGQALAVDSIRHAVITNGPGLQYYGKFRGPFSLDMITDDFTIEGWLRFDLENIQNHPLNEQFFIQVDTAFAISYVNDADPSSRIRVYIYSQGIYNQIYEATFPNSQLNGQSWHHFAFTLGTYSSNIIKFYLDGVPLNLNVDWDEIQYIQQNDPNYANNLLTRPLILGGTDPTVYPFVTGFDEVRIWNEWSTQEEIVSNMHRKILQSQPLIGYFDFDDQRNRLNFISDDSYNNNSGKLVKGASFIAENPNIFNICDTLTVKTSNSSTDSIMMTVFNEDNQAIGGVKLPVHSGQVSWVFDLSTFPYSAKRLAIGEICAGSPPGGFITDIPMTILAPAPIATPQCNWGNYYSSRNLGASITNPIMVNGFPSNTTKVQLGLMNGNAVVDTSDYTINSVPYQYCLTLNGSDNYIETAQRITSPISYEISMWFKTTTTLGGCLINFNDDQGGNTNMLCDREIIMMPDGSLVFAYYTPTGKDTLFAENAYNDGSWHCVVVKMDETGLGQLFVDNSLVDEQTRPVYQVYDGYWLLGLWGYTVKNHPVDYPAYFFQGSLANISIVSSSKKADLPTGPLTVNLLYLMNEGTGTTIHDSQGTNPGTLFGSSPNWTKTTTLSTITWEHNMLNLDSATYTFYARVFYSGGGEQGVYYPLGNYSVQNPFSGYTFNYDLSNGTGYFNEGEELINVFTFQTDFSGQGFADWTGNYVRYRFLTPDHHIADQQMYVWTTGGLIQHSMNIDMGDASPGSYLNIEIGYLTSYDTAYMHDFSIPILIRPLLTPTLTGNFGPFQQAIAPGTMVQSNTFYIATEGLTDLSEIIATFYDPSGNVITTANGVKVNNSVWTITQDMALLAPPQTSMMIEYYLGTGHFPAAAGGPYLITIHKTRPDWFGAVGDSAFSNIQESGDNVTFQLNTPFDNSYMINNSAEMDIPGWVPLIGGSSAVMDMPTANAYLKYVKSQSKLELNQPPVFFQKVFNLGAGHPSTLSFDYNYSQTNSYDLDAQNNLFATQNFSTGGNITSGFSKLVNIVDRVKEIIQAAEVTNPESIIVSPSFGLTATGSFEYSSRQRLMVDSVTGKWGSFGNLDVDANPDHGEAYNNSASYHFYSGGLGIEFYIGAQLIEGAVSGNFGLDGRFLLGFGESYVTIPKYTSKFLKSFAFQTYGRFFIDILWGWYDKTVWGPKLFYSTTIWGDDMTNAFPPMGNKNTVLNAIPANSSSPELAREVRPVSSFAQMPLPRAQSSVQLYKGHLLFNWLEQGAAYGERILRGRSFDLTAHRFSKRNTIETNSNALNSPVSDVTGDSVAFVTWAQSRHTDKSFISMRISDPLEQFVKSQDIWFAVYDLKKDSLLQTTMIQDDQSSYTSGRAEANPKVTLISSSRAIITWHVVDPDKNEGAIWYVILEKKGAQWDQSSPAIAVSGKDVRTQVKIASPSENRALMVWLSTSKEHPTHSSVMSSQFDGSSWTTPERLSGQNEPFCNYLDLCMEGDAGGVAYTKFVEDTLNGNHEKLMLIPWQSDHWMKDQALELMVDSIDHLQLPRLAIYTDGTAAVGVKRERFMAKNADQKISQVDVFKGNLFNPGGTWYHSAGNPYICDTMRQVSELNLGFITRDTLMVLTQEHEMSAANAASVPRNGVVFGNPYMDLVLRGFTFRDDGSVGDVDESNYFLGLPPPDKLPESYCTMQCYPNPCAAQTTVRFNISGSSKIALDLYNMEGKFIATLINRDMNAGMYDMDLNTSFLQPGTYILHLRTGKGESNLKLIVSR